MIVRGKVIGINQQKGTVTILTGRPSSCAHNCENCSSCWLGGGSPWDMYKDYIDGKKEIAEINAEYNARYLRG